MSLERANKLLQKHGIKKTAGRLALLNVLLKAGKPLSHKKICEKLAALPYDQASIYRSLKTFLSSGIVHRIEGDKHTWLFAFCSCNEKNHCHPHFFCRSCGKCECLTDYRIPEIDDINESYYIEEKRFYLSGICKNCAS